MSIYKILEDKFGQAEVLSQLSHDSRNIKHAQESAEESLALYEQIGYQNGSTRQKATLATLAYHRGDYASARKWIEEALKTQRLLNYKSGISMSLELYGCLAFRDGDYEQAHAYFDECIKLADEIGETDSSSFWPHVNLAYVLLKQRQITLAYDAFKNSIRQFQSVGNKIGIIFAIEGFASLAVLQDQPERAAWLFAWADATRETVDDTRPPVEQADVDRDLATLRAQLDDATFAEAQAAGRAMSMDEAIAYALQAIDNRQ